MSLKLNRSSQVKNLESGYGADATKDSSSHVCSARSHQTEATVGWGKELPTAFSTNGFGSSQYPHVKELTWAPTSHHIQKLTQNGSKSAM